MQHVPKVARLLALTHKWEGMVRQGEVKDYAEIARMEGDVGLQPDPPCTNDSSCNSLLFPFLDIRAILPGSRVARVVGQPGRSR